MYSPRRHGGRGEEATKFRRAEAKKEIKKPSVFCLSGFLSFPCSPCLRGKIILHLSRILFLVLFFSPVTDVQAWNQLPLTTDSPQALPSGQVVLEIGLQYLNRSNFPFCVSSESVHRDVWSIPTLAFNIGVSERVELQFAYEVLFVEEPERGIKQRWQSGDLAFFTKLSLFPERRYWPGAGLKFGAKLPNADNTYRVGTDETDLAFAGLVEKTIGPATVTANLGVLILGNPFRNATQDDLLAYGFAVGLPWRQVFAWRLELTGQTLGTAHNERASAMLGLNFDDGRSIWKITGRSGLLENSENWGMSVGVQIRVH